MFMRILAITIMAAALAGCISTAVDIVTLPVKAASKTVDVLTTSQSEADEKRGRAIRKREECIGKEDRRAARRGREPDYSRCPEAG
jgi:spermidine/putrescine-binding protein